MDAPRFIIPGSETRHEPGGSWLDVDAAQEICPTVLLRRPERAGDFSRSLLSGIAQSMTREQAEKLLTADESDLAKVRAFAAEYGLTIVSENAEARSVRLSGSVAAVGKAFGVGISWRVEPTGTKYLSYQGSLSLPASLAGSIEAILGLDQRPIAHRVGAQ